MCPFVVDSYTKPAGIILDDISRDNLKERVRNAPGNDIVSVVSEHLSLTRKGSTYVGLCPFHPDTHPSMTVNPQMQIFKCFACGAGGDVFKFLQMRENITFPQALERLAMRAGIEMKSRPRRRDTGKADANTILRVNTWALRYFRKMFTDETAGKEARDYCISRGIPLELADAWQIGSLPDTWDEMTKAAIKAGISEDLLVESGIAIRTKSGSLIDNYKHRLIFPIIDTAGKVIGFGGRTLGDDKRKYVNSPATAVFDKSNSVYGIDKARHAIVRDKFAVLVEGYTDVIMSHHFGIDNVVAALGTSVTDGQIRLLKRFVGQVVMLLDSDIAGQSAADRALSVCVKQGVDVKVTFVPDGKDPCEFLLSSGADAFREVIDNAVDVFEFKWAHLKEQIDAEGSTAEKHANTVDFLRFIAEAISAGSIDDISLGLLIRRLAGLTGLTANQIKTRLGQFTQNTNRNIVSKAENRMVQSISRSSDATAQAQWEIIGILLNAPSNTDRAREFIDPSQISDEPLKRAAEVIIALYDSRGPDFKFTDVLAEIEDTNLASFLVQLEDEGRRKKDYVKRLDSAAELIEYHRRAAATLKTNTEDTESIKKAFENLKDIHKSGRKNLRLDTLERWKS